MIIKLSGQKTLISLLAVTLLLLLANIAALVYTVHFDPVNFVARLFDFNEERNIPTLYSCIILFSSSLLLLLITYLNKKKGDQYLPWLGLSLVFLFLTVDEMSSIHEYLNSFFDFSGLLYYGWVIPYSLLLIIFLFIYIPFIRKLPIRFIKLFLISGLIFVSGALGIEMLGGLQEQTIGAGDAIYMLFYTIEELFEMVGVAFFIYSLLLFLNSEFEDLNLVLEE